MVTLDVDGVLSPMCEANPAEQLPQWWPDAVHTRVWGLPCWYSPSLVARINAVAALPGVRMHWLTSWEESAAVELAPVVGLHGSDWLVHHRSNEGPCGWWKASEVADLLALTQSTGSAPALLGDADPSDAAAVSSRTGTSGTGAGPLVVWVDDDIDDYTRDRLGETSSAGRRALLSSDRLVRVCPSLRVGLTPALVDELDAVVATALASQSS